MSRMAAKKSSKKTAKKTTAKKQSKKAAKKKQAKKANKKSVKKSSKKTAKKAATKKSVKKATKKAPETPTEEKQPFPTVAVVVGIVFVAVIILFAALFTAWMTPQEPTTVPGDDEVVAVVNGQAITQQDVVLVQSALGQQAQMMGEEELVDQLIMQTLLLQEAEVRGITVTHEEARAEFSALLEAQGVSEDEFSGLLAQQGQDLDLLLEEFRKNLVLEQLAAELDEVSVTEEDAIEFYEEYAAIAGEDTPSYEELREEIIEFLEEQERARALTDLAEALAQDATIERFN